MKEELINFETARLAKIKGFDEAAAHYYILDFQNFKADGVLKKTSLPNDLDSKNIYNFVKRKNQPHLTNAPTQSALQRWLREVHNIDLLVTSVNGRELTRYVSKIYVNKIWMCVVGHSENYEKTFEIGLQRSLNLIKNETNN